MVICCRLKVSRSPSSPSSSSSSSSSSCSHPQLMDGRCTVCGVEDQHLYSTASPFRYICKGLRISPDEVNRIRESEFESIRSGNKQKLFLVLDLDHTLLHTVPINRLSPTDQSDLLLCNLSSSSKQKDNVTLFRSRKGNKVTKLRPFVRTFLEQASQLFDLSIYTMGGRSYAKKMARLLDPDNKLFGCRVISRKDNREKNKKSLDLVLAAENAVVIVDDTPSVWGKHRTNLITIEKYNYFSSQSKAQVVNRQCRVMAPLMDEKEADDELLLTLDILKDVHSRFFNDPAMGKDVRKVLEAMWKDTDQNQMDCT